MVAVSVSEVNLLRPPPKNSVVIFEHKSSGENDSFRVWTSLLSFEQAIMPETLPFGVDMFWSTCRAHGVDVWRCWVPCNK